MRRCILQAHHSQFRDRRSEFISDVAPHSLVFLFLFFSFFSCFFLSCFFLLVLCLLFMLRDPSLYVVCVLPLLAVPTAWHENCAICRLLVIFGPTAWFAGSRIVTITPLLLLLFFLFVAVARSFHYGISSIRVDSAPMRCEQCTSIFIPLLIRWILLPMYLKDRKDATDKSGTQ